MSKFGGGQNAGTPDDHYTEIQNVCFCFFLNTSRKQKNLQYERNNHIRLRHGTGEHIRVDRTRTETKA